MQHLHDPQGYERYKAAVDYAVLKLAAKHGGASTHEIAEKLHDLGIGDAKSNRPADLAYSSTGAILRSALDSLYRLRLVVSYSDFPLLFGLGSPSDKSRWNYTATSEGLRKLQAYEDAGSE